LKGWKKVMSERVMNYGQRKIRDIERPKERYFNAAELNIEPNP